MDISKFVVIRFREVNSEFQEYVSRVYVFCSDRSQFDTSLTNFENLGRDQCVFTDHSEEPPKFSESGGFASDFLSAKDQDGNDRADWAADWYGKVGA